MNYVCIYDNKDVAKCNDDISVGLVGGLRYTLLLTPVLLFMNSCVVLIVNHLHHIHSINTTSDATKVVVTRIRVLYKCL